MRRSALASSASPRAIEPGAHLRRIKHGVTRYRITLDCYAARYLGGVKTTPAGPVRLKPAELAEYPLNATGPGTLAALIPS